MPTRAFLAVLAAAAVMLAVLLGRDRTESQEELAARAASLIKSYGMSLRGVLQTTLDSSGPVGAVDFCHKEAPALAARASRDSGWHISRTSLKPRNAASAPDDYERAAMQDFAARIAAGEAIATLKRAEIVEQNGERVFRYIQAIPTGQLCLTCHGTELTPKLSAKIRELYPTDQATGYKEGDMRGVFTLSKKL